MKMSTRQSINLIKILGGFLIAGLLVGVGFMAVNSFKNTTVLEVTFRNANEYIENLATDLEDVKKQRYAARDSARLYQTKYLEEVKNREKIQIKASRAIDSLKTLQHDQKRKIDALNLDIKRLQLERSSLDN